MIRLKPQEVKRQYAQMMKAYIEELKLKCGQYHIDIIEADINDDFRHVLHSYLIKRGKLV
jgi:CTP:phosphocholine cytidylyltransferase-like protein